MSRQPTSRGIKRMSCAYCGAQGYSQWSACALKGPRGAIKFFVACIQCDVELNEAAVRLMFGDKYEDELAAYRKRLLG